MTMGARRHWQEGALAPPPLPLPGNVVKCFCALVITAKRPVDELFMHYFHNLSSAYGDFAPRPSPEINYLGPAGELSSANPLLANP